MTGGLAVELPGNLDAIMIHASIPSLSFAPQRLEAGDPSLAQTLPREDSNFDLRLIQPTAVGGGVMNREAVPDIGGHLGPEHRCQRPLGMAAEIVHHEVDGCSRRVCHGQFDRYLGKFEA